MPSPVMAEVGTTLTYVRTSGLSQYSAVLSPCSARASLDACHRVSNSLTACSGCCASDSLNGASFRAFQPYMRSHLLRATTKGVFRMRSRLSDSIVCCSSPCMMSTTRMAMSHSPEPRVRRLVNDSWPGVSMTSKPGRRMVKSGGKSTLAVRSARDSAGMKVAPICWVMPPASPSWTFVRRMLSRILVLPVSTWPRMHTTGDRSCSRLLAATATAVRARRRARLASLR